MTPAIVLNNPVFGYRWPRIARSSEVVPEFEQQNLTPRSLQVKSVPDELSGFEVRQEQLRALALNQRGRIVGSGRREIVVQREPRVLSEGAINVLGENGLRRFREFAQYEQGWNVGEGAPLSPRSIDALDSFLTHLPGLAEYHPSLFLTPAGNLELAWDNQDGNEIEVEFWPDRIEYYIEALDEERAVRLEVFPQFIEKVRTLIR